MDIVQELLKIDAKKTEELNTGEYKSARLARLLGVEGEVSVKIQEIKARRLSDIMNKQYDRQGNFDPSMAYDARLLICVDGVTEPRLKEIKLSSLVLRQLSRKWMLPSRQMIKRLQRAHCSLLLPLLTRQPRRVFTTKIHPQGKYPVLRLL